MRTCLGRLALGAMVILSASTSPAASLVTDLGGGGLGLMHRWRFDGNFADEIGGWNAYITNWNGGSPSGWGFGSDHVDLNNGWDDRWSSQATYVRLPNNIISNLATQGSSSFTFEMWVNTDDGHWNSGYFAFAKENGDGGEGNPRLAWTSYENDYFKVSWRQSVGGYWHQMHSPENLIPPMAGFQHLVLVVSEGAHPAGDELKVYVDGVYKGASSGLPAWEGPGLDTASWWNGIGGYLGIAPDNDPALDGKIYDFRIWRRALTDAEITQSYNLGSEVPTGQPPPPTIAYTILEWNMDDKPIWYTYGGATPGFGYNWSENSFLPTCPIMVNNTANTLGVGGSSGWWIGMDNTSLAPPNTPQWAGGGMGGGGPVDFSKFTDNLVGNYIVSFDARVEGLIPGVTNTAAGLQLFLNSPNGNVQLDFPVAAQSNWVHSVFGFNSAYWNTTYGGLPKASFSTNYNTYTNLWMQWNIENAASANWGYDPDNLIVVDNIKVEHLIVSCPAITVEKVGTDVRLTWPAVTTGGYVQVQRAAAVGGPYVDVPGATNSPVTLPYTNSAGFFRTHWKY